MSSNPISLPAVLIIEDQPETRASLGRQFRRAGWDSVGVADSLTAIGYIHSSVRNPPDCYIVDLKLPGKSGPQIIQIIRQSGIRSPRTRLPVRVVGYTCSDATDPIVLEAIAAGADAILLKPCEFERVLAVVDGRDPGSIAIPPRAPVPPLTPTPAPASGPQTL